MTASTYASIAQTILNLIRIAVAEGLSAQTPVKVLLKGSTLQGDLSCPQRNAVISFAKPDVTGEVQIWVNPANRLIFKSNPATQQWQQIFEYSDIFSAYGIISGSAGGTIGAADGQPVQDLNALKALTLPLDKSLIYVENERAIYGYDKESIDSGPGVIVPNDNIGRWLLVSNQSGTIINLDGGIF